MTDTTNITVTQNERDALEACLNYDNREAQLSDNMSVGGIADFMHLFGWNAQQVGGLVSSLEAKGLVFRDPDEEVNGQPDDTVWLTEDGVNLVFDLREADDQNQ